MTPKARYTIRRTDRRTEDIVIESEGLTIGRLPGNDLVLNHRAVAETHAGIKEIDGEFWLFNLSEAYDTILDGQVREEAPLGDGAVAQIGPYLLRAARLAGGLSLTVEIAVGAVMAEEKSPASPTPAPRGFDASSLRVFWEKRKREAGKIAVKTPLHPKGGQRIGKIQFNWGPTLDLRAPWRRAWFVWGGAIVVGLSALAMLVWSRAFSPGELSAPHAGRIVSARQAALRANGGACMDCHAATAEISDKCANCHRTPQFAPTVSAAHQREGIGCVGCHSEHQGAAPEAGLLNPAVCVQCHNGHYRIRAGERRGEPLPVPHGGAEGYPKETGKWAWPGLPAVEWRRRSLPEALAERPAAEQFHALHRTIYAPGGTARRIACRDCHTAGVPQSGQADGAPRAVCATCHNFSQQAAIPAANCVTCHQPHGRSRDLAALLAAAGGDYRRLKTVAEARAATVVRAIPAAYGGADVLRQERAAPRWASLQARVGAVPWYGWFGLLLLLPLSGLVWLARRTAREQAFLRSIEPAAAPAPADAARPAGLGPVYPHPVIDPLLCIGCHACVEACPHDVLDIVGGVATPVALDQCMEDTSCMVECPTSPKACVVINTRKVIPPRKVPRRDQRLMTDVPGIYLIGDVSGVPLIKNAINEGAQAIEYILEDLHGEDPQGAAADPAVPFDVAIIGVGPAGLSAAAIARQRGLRYVAIEQNRVAATIQNFPAGKYVFYKPDTVEARGGIPLAGVGGRKEELLAEWMEIVRSHGLEIREEESCKEIRREGDHFVVATAGNRAPGRNEYRARCVLLAIGNHGTPMKLGVPGEDLPDRVKYRLSDPDDYRGRKCMIVGAGNSAIEAAVELTGFRRDGDAISFTRDNEVSLIVRSDLKGDLKLGNKMNLYDCIDAGRIRVYFRTTIREIREGEVVLMNASSKAETARLPNDFIFALIGSERPTKFLEGLGIKIG